jgi:chromosome segregation ATPase
MAGIVKTVIRIGVIGGLVTGAAMVIAGPDRVGALATQTKTRIIKVIDDKIEDPIAMRAQLRSLESQYPSRIAEVRTHLSEVEQQIAQSRRDKAVAMRVVELARRDLEELNDLLARAGELRSEGTYRVVNINFDDRTYGFDEAHRRARDISETARNFSARADDYDRDLASLRADEEQLRSLLAKLETEQTDFQSQLAHLERQIDAVARKERMVSMMSERQKTLDELSRYNVASLDQFKGTLARRHAELDSRLATLAGRDRNTSYEDRARVQIDRESSSTSNVERSRPSERELETSVIEIGPDRNAEEAAPRSAGSVASRSRVTVN